MIFIEKIFDLIYKQYYAFSDYKDSLSAKLMNLLYENMILKDYHLIEWLENGGNPNLIFDDKCPLLYHFAYQDDYECVKLLLEFGANPDLQDYYYYTALHEACYNGNYNMIKLLLLYGASDNIKNYKGNTPIDIVNNYNTKDKEDYLILFENG